MWDGMRFSSIQTFLKENDFDILTFQEVSGPGNHHGVIKCDIDCFAEIQNVLGQNYAGELIESGSFSSSPKAYEGNVIFYKKTFKLLERNDLWLYKRSTPFPVESNSYEDMGRAALHLVLEQNKQKLNVVTTHLAWAKTSIEQPHQRKQNEKLINFMQNLSSPFILTGDFNINPEQPTIFDLEKMGKNLVKENNISNTIDPKNHRAWEVIKPGFTVDYIFVSPDITAKNVAIVDADLSDHFGLQATLEI